MASVLYTEGDSHEIDGVICQMERVPPEDTAMLLTFGWFASVEDLVASRKEPEVKGEPNTDEMSALKAKAKELNLTGYGKCSLEKLRAKVKEAEEAQD